MCRRRGSKKTKSLAWASALTRLSIAFALLLVAASLLLSTFGHVLRQFGFAS